MMIVSTSTSDDGCTRVVIAGTLDDTMIWELCLELSAVLACLPRHATIDLSALHAIEGAGVGLLFAFVGCLRHRGAQARIVGLQGQPLTLFRRFAFDDAGTASVRDMA